MLAVSIYETSQPQLSLINKCTQRKHIFVKHIKASEHEILVCSTESQLLPVG